MKRIILILTLFTTGLSLQGEDLSLTVDEAVNIAIANNLGLKGQSYGLDTLRLNRDNAWNAFLPNLTVGTSLVKTNSAPSSQTIAIPNITPVQWMTVTPKHNWSLGFSMKASLDFSLALFYGLDYTVREYERGGLEYDDAVRKVRRDVQKTFFTLLELKKNQELFVAKIDTAKGRYEQIQRLFNAGLASEFDVLSAQVGYENLKPVLGNFEQAYLGAQNSFKILLLGLKATDNITLVGKIETTRLDLELESLLNMGIEQSPMILLLKKQIQVLETSITGLQVQAYTPFLSLGYELQPRLSYSLDPFSDDIFSDLNKSFSDSGMFTIVLGLGMNSFLPFGKIGTNLQGMENTRSTLETSLIQVLRATEVEIENLHNNLENTVRQIATMELNESLAQKTYQLAEEGFKTGVRTLLELENSEDDLRQAQQEVLSSRVKYIQTLFDLEYILGKLPQ